MVKPTKVFAIIFNHRKQKDGKDYFTWMMQSVRDPRISVVSHKYKTEASCKRSMLNWSKKLNFEIQIINYGGTYASEYRHPEMIEY